MKRKKKTILFSLLLLLPLCLSCQQDQNKSEYTPVYMERSELEQSVQFLSTSRDLVNPGKIYYKDPFIYVNERYKGVHVINNSDPTNPLTVGFIQAPGCLDMAIKENILYVDNAIDLVAVNLDTKQVTERIRDVFPEPLPPDDLPYYEPERPEGLVIVSWRRMDRSK